MHDFVADREVAEGQSIQEPQADGYYTETRNYVNLSLEGRF